MSDLYNCPNSPSSDIAVNKYLRFAEQCFIILGLSTLSGVVYALTLVDLLPKPIFVLIKYFIWAILIILIGIFWKKTIVAIGRSILFCLLITLAFLSFIWSDIPNFTLSIGIDILIMACFGLYFAKRFTLKEQVQLIARTLLITAIFSTIFALVFPAIGIDHEEHPGAWQGVYGQKNAFGNAMVLSSFTFLTLPKENSNLYRWFGFSFSLILVLLSASKSSLVMSILLVLIMMLFKNFRWQGKISVIFLDMGILILGCVGLLVFTYWVDLLTGLGRDPTLTGRTPLWGYALTRLMERPFLGYGLNAFWAPHSQYAVEAGQAVGTGWIAPNSHNGLLDLALSVGLIGVSLFLISYCTTFIQALKQAYATKNLESLWPLAFLIFLAMNNVTESRLLGEYNLSWILFATVVFTLNQRKQIQKINNLKSKSYVSAT